MSSVQLLICFVSSDRLHTRSQLPINSAASFPSNDFSFSFSDLLVLTTLGFCFVHGLVHVVKFFYEIESQNVSPGFPSSITFIYDSLYSLAGPKIWKRPSVSYCSNCMEVIVSDPFSSKSVFACLTNTV